MTSESFSSRVATWLLGHPRTVAAMLIVLFTGSLATLPFLRIETGWESFYDPHTPEKKVLDEVKGHFVNDELLYVGYESPDPFSKTALEAVRKLGTSLEALSGTADDGQQVKLIAEVTSLASVGSPGTELEFAL